ncbi:MAG: hypothetical protein WB762_34775 [Candidatus Sulfotelmatobacter sp.]
MGFRLAATLLVLTASFTFAQNSKQRLCDAPSATTVKHDGGVIVEKVMLRGKWGSNGGSAYLPDKDIADGAIVFSHSAINTNNGSAVDLLPLALTLAHAGAAVIVPARSLAWPPTDQSSNREGAVVICAEHWLIDHTKVFNNGEPTVNDKNIVVREGYAYVGPRVCDPTVLDQCDFMSPFASEDCALKRYCRQSVWVPLGETEGGDNTRSIISDQGSKTASWLQKNLGLAPIRAVAAAESF